MFDKVKSNHRALNQPTKLKERRFIQAWNVDPYKLESFVFILYTRVLKYKKLERPLIRSYNQ